MIPLSLAEPGKEQVIKRVGGNAEVRQHLENLGFVVGGTVTVLSGEKDYGLNHRIIRNPVHDSVHDPAYDPVHDPAHQPDPGIQEGSFQNSHLIVICAAAGTDSDHL